MKDAKMEKFARSSNKMQFGRQNVGPIGEGEIYLFIIIRNFKSCSVVAKK